MLDALAASHRVVAVDLPGHGSSPDPPPDYDVADLAGDLGRTLDREGMRRAAWLGYSMGGRMALAAAILRPDRVERLILESASPGLAKPEERMRRRRSDEELAERLLEGGLESFVDDWMELPLFRSRRKLPEGVLEQERSRRMENRASGLAAALRTLGTGGQPSFWDRLAEVRVPTLVLVGAEDEKYLRLGRRMVAALPDARLRVIPDAGHTVHLERPDRWIEAVRGFLR
jgi:2-succinyl-6-hydroxy-2,4-cyclohexadiene-1-carboxylate synthase